jgi:adenylate cyclase class IV
MMGDERLNLELKARDPDPERSLRVCRDLGAEEKGILFQRDTYFEVPRGRLKLRREGEAVAHLIAYERANAPRRRESRYRIVTISDPQGLEGALASVLGIAAVVTKTRRLFLFDGVRIHLDLVDGLGSFVELEAVAGQGDRDLPRFEALLSDLQLSFGVGDADLIGESYCDLVAKNLHSASNT